MCSIIQKLPLFMRCDFCGGSLPKKGKTYMKSNNKRFVFCSDACWTKYLEEKSNE